MRGLRRSATSANIVSPALTASTTSCRGTPCKCCAGVLAPCPSPLVRLILSRPEYRPPDLARAALSRENHRRPHRARRTDNGIGLEAICCARPCGRGDAQWDHAPDQGAEYESGTHSALGAPSRRPAVPAAPQRPAREARHRAFAPTDCRFRCTAVSGISILDARASASPQQPNVLGAETGAQRRKGRRASGAVALSWLACHRCLGV